LVRPNSLCRLRLVLKNRSERHCTHDIGGFKSHRPHERVSLFESLLNKGTEVNRTVKNNQVEENYRTQGLHHGLTDPCTAPKQALSSPDLA